MAKSKISDKELLSRREFFRKGAQTTLPILVSIALPSIITSCTPDDDWGCLECSSICSYTCHESCSSTSTSSSCDSCSSGCVSSCSGNCSTTCEGSSQSSSCSGCSNSCSGDCAESCGNSCGNNCSSTCKNSASGSGNEDYDSVSSASGSIDGYEYVDLGLSVKWARYNYGTSSPSSRGSYMEFTEGATGNNSTEVRISLLAAGYESGDSIAGSGFDSISQAWGNKWRTPSKLEWEELINNSNIERYDYNGTIGLKFTSKKNGKSIFLPGAGYKGDDNKYHYGYYWTSILSYIKASGAHAYYIWWSFRSGIYTLHDNTKDITDIAMPIRAITDGGNNPSSCNNSCTATCANNSTGSGCSSCGSNCSSSCGSNCSGACVNTCSTGCGEQCKYSCGGGCSQTCAGYCSGGCEGVSKGSCSECTGSCSYLCSKSCSQYCYSSCTNMGVKSL